MKRFFFALALGVLTLRALGAQSPAPVVVQAVTPPPATSSAPAPAASPAAADLNEAIQMLQEMQTNNLETIKKQEAALQTLDTLQKAAADIKIYSKRG